MKVIKNNTKLLIGIIIGVIITSSIGITIAYNINASQISYEDTNVASAITNLYTLSQTHCPNGKNCYESILCDTVHHCNNQDTNPYVSTSDIITYGTESFRVISNDGILVRLLPVYNITVTISNPVQSSTAGTIAFAPGTTSYWNNNITDYSDMPYIYNNQSNLYEYVEAYKITLRGLGMQVVDATLISYQEAIFLSSSKYTWAYNQYYWTGSAKDGFFVHLFYTNGIVDSYATFQNSSDVGIRPIIIISASNL